MSRVLRWILLTAPLVLGAAAALGYWALQTYQASVPPPPVEHVPASYQEFRQGEGHVVHVQQHGVACRACHEDDAGAFTTPQRQVCGRCHEAQAAMRHALDGEASTAAVGAAGTHGTGAQTADCVACHSFGPDTGKLAWNCIRCHGEVQGARRAVRVEAHGPCALCHDPHGEPSVKPQGCINCHGESENVHGAQPGQGPDNCLACHTMHAPAAPASQGCVNCHDDRPHALFDGGHTGCGSCHLPHQFDKGGTKPCRSCHQDTHVLSEDSVRAHARCESCHDPHAPKDKGEARCRNCHRTIKPSHPEVLGRACLACHTPHSRARGRSRAGAGAHAAQASAAAKACTHFHRELGDRDSAHAGETPCVACHAPHAFSQVAQSRACKRCHADLLEDVAKVRDGGHARCLGCHTGHPHSATLPARACTECHSESHAASTGATGVTVSPAHRDCTGCHAPHTAHQTPSSAVCARCHASEHATASRARGHRNCLTCHAPHDGGKRPVTRCTGCHARQARAPHGDLEQGCTACHSIHNPAGLQATPRCTTCHRASSLPGLHKEKGHSDCLTCHQGAHKAGPWSARKTCIACHAGQRNHEPEAKLCQGCHVFTQ